MDLQKTYHISTCVYKLLIETVCWTFHSCWKRKINSKVISQTALD